jgi:hypothetical protein
VPLFVHRRRFPAVLLKGVWITDRNGNDPCLKHFAYLGDKGAKILVRDFAHLSFIDLFR